MLRLVKCPVVHGNGSGLGLWRKCAGVLDAAASITAAHATQPVPTCGDTQPSTSGAQSWYCDPAKGLAQNPNAATYPNPSDLVGIAVRCSLQAQR
jgi:hypothetical protein